MSRFKPILNQLYSKLELPQPEKSRVILEIASDIEATYESYLEKGYSNEDALRITEEHFKMDENTIQELNAIHQNKFQQILSKVSNQAQTWWERSILLLILLFLLAFSGQFVITKKFIQEASQFIWPIIGIGCIMIIFAIAKFYIVFLKKEKRVTLLRSNLFYFLFLGGAGLIIGLYGFLFETYKALEQLLQYRDQFFRIMFVWLYECSSMMLISIWICIIAAIIWYVLDNQIKRLEIAEANCLLEL